MITVAWFQAPCPPFRISTVQARVSAASLSQRSPPSTTSQQVLRNPKCSPNKLVICSSQFYFLCRFRGAHPADRTSPDDSVLDPGGPSARAHHLPEYSSHGQSVNQLPWRDATRGASAVVCESTASLQERQQADADRWEVREHAGSRASLLHAPPKCPTGVFVQPTFKWSKVEFKNKKKTIKHIQSHIDIFCKFIKDYLEFIDIKTAFKRIKDSNFSSILPFSLKTVHRYVLREECLPIYTWFWFIVLVPLFEILKDTKTCLLQKLCWSDGCSTWHA